MSLLQFALFFPFLLSAFSYSVQSLQERNCRARAFNTAIQSSLEETVKETNLNMPLKFNLSCGYILKKTGKGREVVNLKRFTKTRVVFELPTGVDYEM